MASLIHRWKLTENANDSVGTLHLTNNGAVTFSADGASFNGSSQWLSGTYGVPAQNTMSVWVKCEATFKTAVWIGHHSGVADNWTGISGNTSTTNLSAGNNTQVAAKTSEYTSANYLNQLVHICATASATELKLYKNGTLLATASITASTSGNSFGIGTYGGNNYNGPDFAHKGKIIDARIYDNYLSAGDVSALYAAGPNPSATPTANRIIPKFLPKVVYMSASAGHGWQ